MKIRLEGGLPFVTATLRFGGRELSLPQVILDTGSASSVFSADEVSRLGLLAEPQDTLRRIRGVGGSEFVFARRLDALGLGELRVDAFEVQVGAMDYGFPLQGLLGLDFLRQAGAVIDLRDLEVRG
jgi:predicted aspartyl protease